MKTQMKRAFVGAAAAAVAAGAFAGTAASDQTPTSPSWGIARLDCKGINGCKGHSACKGAANGCKGQNACKGQGWMPATSQLDCLTQGGSTAN